MARRQPGKKSPREPDVPFHMSTRRRASAIQRPQTPESNSTPTKPPSSSESSPLSSPPTSVESSPKSVPTLPKGSSKPSSKRKGSFNQSADDGLELNASPLSKKAKVTPDASLETEYPEEVAPREPHEPPAAHMFYGADAKTRYRPSEPSTESAQSSPPKALRGGGRGRGRGGRLANGGGRGRGKARDHGDRDDTPEPPPKKRVLTEEDRAMIASLKARQQDLKKFYQVVGAQQTDVLDLIASRDVAKLVRRPKAHKKVPEFEEVTQELKEAMERESDIFLLKYQMDVEAADRAYEMGKELIERTFTDRVLMAQKEHAKGAEGEIMLFEQAGHAANDETHTEAGSDADAIPMYHPMPEPGFVRGYNSSQITDEKALQRHDTSFNDQVRREVIDDDIITPMAKALFEKNAEYKREQAKTKSMNMTALSNEAMKQLKQIPGYLIPRPMLSSEFNSFGLSALADAADFMAERYPRNNYEYVPLPAGQHFPINALNFAPLPGTQSVVQPGVQQGIKPGIQQGVQRGLQQGTRPGLHQGIQRGVPRNVQPAVQKGVQQKAQPGVQPGGRPGIQRGNQPGIQPGFRQGVQRGDQQGIQRGGQQTVQPVVQQAVQQGVQRGIQQGVRPGVQPIAQQGMQQGVQPGVQQGVERSAQQDVQQGVQPAVRRSVQQRRPAPPPPAQTFIFQPPQQFFNHQQQRMPPPPPQPIPVTFVNSTVSSRKSGNKGGQRMLLPKMG